MGGLTPWPNRLISSNRPSTRSPTQDSATTAPAEAFVIGYQAGASREITEEEIAAAMDETRKFTTLPGAWLENIIRIAFDAARRKAMEE